MCTEERGTRRMNAANLVCGALYVTTPQSIRCRNIAHFSHPLRVPAAVASASTGAVAAVVSEWFGSPHRLAASKTSWTAHEKRSINMLMIRWRWKIRSRHRQVFRAKSRRCRMSSATKETTAAGRCICLVVVVVVVVELIDCGDWQLGVGG